MWLIILILQMLYHCGWIQAVEAAKSGLNAGLLVRHPESEEVFMNFDPHVVELILDILDHRKAEVTIVRLSVDSWLLQLLWFQ